MGVSNLDRKQRLEAVSIESWADDMAKLHRRECTEKMCGGRKKIWWTVRHPNSTEHISNSTAREYVVNRTQACGILEQRLTARTIPWLPTERRVYRARSAEERAQLLGHEFLPTGPDEEAPAVNLKDPFPEAREAMPQTTPGREADRQRKLAWKAEQAALRTRETSRVSGSPNGFGAAVDALSGRR